MTKETSHWDLVVIGGEREGHNVAAEAASRGARVALVMPGFSGNGRTVGNQQVRILTGMPRFVGPGALEVTTKSQSLQLSAETIVIGIGSRPESPSSFLVDNRFVLDADSFEQAVGAHRVAIVGAGRDGLRAATLLASVGVDVSIFDRRYRLLEESDSELVDLMLESVAGAGVTLRLGEDVAGVEPTASGANVRLSGDDCEFFDRAVVSVGRRGNTESLDLERIGLETDEQGRLWCDERFKTWVEPIRAVGSVIGFPVALRCSLDQGARCAVDVLFAGGFERRPADAVMVSTSQPEIAQTGRTTEDLVAGGVDYQAGRVGFDRKAANSLKLLWNRRSGRVLGAHAMGPDVTDSIGRVAAAMRRCLTVDRLLSSCENDRLLRQAATAERSDTVDEEAVVEQGAAWRIDAV
ncbi:MAG: FAD-dependent oxidoreductase [Planctomycetaceae bacterium]|jgi:NAD(P) transhydrogenase|nr:FAD-dependent oxidoreductase [Planctomycetaceae bacterium]